MQGVATTKAAVADTSLVDLSVSLAKQAPGYGLTLGIVIAIVTVIKAWFILIARKERTKLENMKDIRAHEAKLKELELKEKALDRQIIRRKPATREDEK